MPSPALSRRSFLNTSAMTLAAAATGALANPAQAAAQAVGVKPGDLPDLTIKQVKVYVINRTPTRAAAAAAPAGAAPAGTAPRPAMTEQLQTGSCAVMTIAQNLQEMEEGDLFGLEFVETQVYAGAGRRGDRCQCRS